MAYNDIGTVPVGGPTKTSWPNGARNNQEDHEGRIGTNEGTISSQTTTISNHESRIVALEGTYGNVILGYTQGSYAVYPSGSGTIINWTWPSGSNYLVIHAGEHARGNDHDADGYTIINLATNLLYGSIDYASDLAGVRAHSFGGVWPGGNCITYMCNMTIAVFTPGTRNIQIAFTTGGGSFCGSCTITAYR